LSVEEDFYKEEYFILLRVYVVLWDHCF